MYRVLRSTTSLTMCVALALPVGGFAQTTPGACATDGSTVQFPCVLPDGTEVTTEDQFLELQAEGSAEVTAPADDAADATADQAQAAAEEEAAAAADAAAEQAEAAATAQAEAEQNAAAAAEAAAEEADAAAQADADAQTEEQAEADTQAAEQAEIEAQIKADAEADAAAEASDEAEAQSEAPAADAEAAADAETSAPEATDEAEAETVEEAEEQAETAPATEQAETEPVEEAEEQAETAPAAEEAEAETTAEQAETAPAAEEAETETTAEQAETAPDAGTERTEEEIAAEQADVQAAEEARATQRAEEAASAAAAAAAADDGSAEAEVTTDEVTADETRASDEEFSTNVTGDSAGNAEVGATAQTDDDSGMSNFEKALLLGLGAVAVGSVLKNGSKVMSNSGDRLVVQDPSGDLRVLKDDSALVRQTGDEVRRETFNDGSSRTTVTKPDGSRVVTILGRDGTVLRRVNVDAQGNEYLLFDDTQAEQQVTVNELPQVQQNSFVGSQQDEEALRRALVTQLRANDARTFSLRQVRDIQQVRALAPEVELDAVRFATGSAAIQPEQARSLASIGTAISEAIQDNPRTVILVEGHTDAVGDAGYNLALSDRRAETVALALTEYFNVPAANLVTQGYGEGALKVQTSTAEAANRRAVVRNITGLLQ